jgi:hypothetical protein
MRICAKERPILLPSANVCSKRIASCIKSLLLSGSNTRPLRAHHHRRSHESPLSQADADFNYNMVRALRRREPAIDFQTAYDAGLHGLDDVVVLDKAAREGRLLVSHDFRTIRGLGVPPALRQAEVSLETDPAVEDAVGQYRLVSLLEVVRGVFDLVISITRRQMGQCHLRPLGML